jgi:energy-coupling factor transporter transmembrane protein EcfT
MLATLLPRATQLARHHPMAALVTSFITCLLLLAVKGTIEALITWILFLALVGLGATILYRLWATHGHRLG